MNIFMFKMCVHFEIKVTPRNNLISSYATLTKGRISPHNFLYQLFALSFKLEGLSQTDDRESLFLPRFESMSFVVNILACKLKIVNNRNWKKT